MRVAVCEYWSVRTRLIKGVCALSIGVGLVAAVAAQPHAQSTPTLAATPLATQTATPAEETPIADTAAIVWAREVDPATNEPTRRATAFITTDPVMYAALPVERIEQGSVVEATWAYNGTPVPGLTASVTVGQTYEHGWVEFHLTLPAGEIWPTGEYTIAIAIDGRQVAESTIDVTVPPS